MWILSSNSPRRIFDSLGERVVALIGAVAVGIEKRDGFETVKRLNV